MLETRAARLSRLHSRVKGVFGRIRVSLKSGVLSRPATHIRGAVVHTTESGVGSLLSIVAYLRSVGTQADSHYVLGDVPRPDGYVDVVRIVPEGKKSWAALSANPYFVMYELIGRAAQSRAYWLAHRRQQIRTLAALIADDILQYGFPLHMRKSPGVLGHCDLHRFGFPNTHTDPGAGFPWDILKGDILYYLALSKLASVGKLDHKPPTYDEVKVKRSIRKHSGAGAKA